MPPHITTPPRFLIIIPRFISQPGEQYIFPVGIGYISAALKQKGYFVKSLDLNRYNTDISQTIEQHIREFDLNVIATGTISAHYKKVKEIIGIAKSAKKDIITIVGGGVISSEPELVYDSLGIDIGILGEGEETIVELAEALDKRQDLSKVHGLIYRTSAEVIQSTPKRKSIKNLEDLPFPDDAFLEGFYESQPRIYNLVSSRSCPFDCTFCYHPIGRVYRQRPLDDIFREVEYSFNRYHPFHYRIIDELFSQKRERLVEFCSRIRPFNVAWDVQMRVCDIDSELLQLMREAGCVLISYGLESGSQRILDSMRKKTKVADIVRAVDITYRSGIQVQGAYIFGDEAETKETATETLSLWLQQHRVGIGMWPIELYPGTPLYQSAVKRGVIKDRLKFIEDGCPSVNVSRMSDADALRLSILMYLLVITYNTVPARIAACTPGATMTEPGCKVSQRFNVTLSCPHCGESQIHKNYPLYNRKKWSCHKCQRRFDVQPLTQWRHWPKSFEIADNYHFEPRHSVQLLQFFDSPLEPGNSVGMSGYSEIDLLGITYLVPTNISLDDVRFGRVQIFAVDKTLNRLNPIVIYDNNYKRLHHPWYLKSRIAELVGDWNQTQKNICIVGIEEEISNLLAWTNLADATIDTVVLLDNPNANRFSDLDIPTTSLDALSRNPPEVILVATTKTQKALCEQLAPLSSTHKTEVTALYSSGTNY